MPPYLLLAISFVGEVLALIKRAMTAGEPGLFSFMQYEKICMISAYSKLRIFGPFVNGR
jgi:hypothetical protein